ncbi:MAG TPA: nicotinate-nucleotide--dimethylbenzimidazole phosphoribosyltransferase [Bryobacteraceae bacterium]|jgi:nicotinate-nucleotide--dimethylbenzimidazole phosphoribosyltransferase|nr:nicotinate-nucleotide--dimethylbenzimidazole phosphoribosyltransferase [Bryobacteraceae bacterium]
MRTAAPITETIRTIRPIDPSWIEAARQRQLKLTKPPGSLGRLEEIANRCAAIRQGFELTAGRPRIVLFAADHGVCAEGVSPYPQAVTAQMVLNFLRGGAAINAIAREGGIELLVVDAGVATPLPDSSDLVSRRAASGTRNFCLEPAMTNAEMTAALTAGVELACDSAIAGCDLLGFGEMGIGNTTSASAIAAALTHEPVEALVGCGTGADDACMARKCSAIQRGLSLHADSLADPLAILRCVGGLEIAAMCGFCLGAAAYRVPVVTDGFIATAAAALAVDLCPAVSGYLFASHCSVEPGHSYLLARLRQEPMLRLEMRLGEGTGAALAIKIMQAAIAAFTGMATFEAAGVSNK